MPQSVKLSDELIKSAKQDAEAADRSVAGQIEHWAKLGRGIEPFLQGASVTPIKTGAALTGAAALQARAAVMGAVRRFVDSDDQSAIAERLAGLPKPQYESDPTDPERIVQVGEDGRRERGRLINRRFVPG